MRTTFLLLLLVCFHMHADTPNWDLTDPNKGWSDDDLVLEYFHNSELQRQWAWELIARYPLRGDERVLDFGCGDGKITAQLSHSLPQGSIVGVDLSEKMISFATRVFPQTHYPSLSFYCSGDVAFSHTKLVEQSLFDRIYSFFVFHLIPQPQSVLERLHKISREGGKLILVTPNGGNRPLFLAATRAFAEYGLTPPWEKRAVDPTQPTMRTVEGVEEIVSSAGWEITYLNQVNTPFAFVNRDELIHWMIGTVSANWDIPKAIAGAFYEKLVTYMVEIDPTLVDGQGVHYFTLSRVHVVATKA